MHPGALRALEFDRIIAVVAGLTVTPTGRDRVAELHPLTDAPAVSALQRATTEGKQFLGDHSGFPLRAPADLAAILDGLIIEGRALESTRLLGLADYLESIEHSRTAVQRATGSYPILNTLVAAVASFRQEIADVRRKIDPSGEVLDDASPQLASIRDRLRRQKTKLRTTMESFIRGRDTSKYLQEQVVTDRNGRHVLMVRAEHRGSIPGIVHGSSASGASLFLEPMATVEINNDIVELQEEEQEEVRRILLALTETFRARASDLAPTLEVATELDMIQARARFSVLVNGVAPAISSDGSLYLKDARHPLLMQAVRDRVSGFGSRDSEDDERGTPPRPPNPEPRVPNPEPRIPNPVPVTVALDPPVRVLIIAGPNTGGKTVAIKTAGLLAVMAQAGLHIPVEPGSTVPVFKSLFADIGDEQSISASLSTFSAHITNVVSMDRGLALPALILLDEVGAGTDPAEGGALGTALIDHFRKRGAHLIATTHYDALKSYASTTENVTSAAFGFNPETFAPTYRLVYGSPGRSLAIEIAARLGMPPTVIAAARANLTDREKQLADHLARVDQDLRKLEQERRQLVQERATVAESAKTLHAREEAIREREQMFQRRLDTRLDEQLRMARREIDGVIDGLKVRAAEMSQQAARRAAASINTGEAGAARADARAAIDHVVGRLKTTVNAPPPSAESAAASGGALEPGARVAVGGLGLEGVIVEIQGKHAEIDMRGKRMRAALRDLRIIGGAATTKSNVSVSVDLQPRESSLSELNVIGCTVDEALTRLERFLDEATMTDRQELRVVHGHGTGQLRRAIAAFLKEHPLVAKFETAPQNQGGGGATVVELKD